MSSVDDDLERRLENWARWYWGGGASGGDRVSSLYRLAGQSRRYSEAPMPVINGEAMVTDTAIHRLDGPHELRTESERPLRAVLRARYLRVAPDGYTLRTLSEIQVASALYITYDTYLRRLKQARKCLLEQLRNGSTDMPQSIQA